MTRRSPRWPGAFHIIDHRDETTVRWSYLRGSFDDHIDLVVVSFRGHYRYGSGGNEDAPHLDAAVKGAHAFDPDAIILDLRELRYEWGDRMSDPLASGWVEAVPVTVIVGDGSRDGMRSLLTAEWLVRPDEFAFEDVDSAVANALQRVETVRLAWQCAQDEATFDTQIARIAAEVDDEGRDANRFFRGVLIDDLLRPGAWAEPAVARKALKSEVAACVAGAPDYAFRVSRLTEKLLRLEETECLPFLCALFAGVEPEDIDLVGLSDEMSDHAFARVMHRLVTDAELNARGSGFLLRTLGAS